MCGFAMRLEEIGRDHRRDHPCNAKAHQHRSNDRKSEILEELAGNARHQADRQEDRDNRKRCGDHGQTDFIRCIDRCLIGGFAHPHMPDDIFNLHDRIVHKHTRNKAERKHRNGIEAESQQIHEPERRDCGERDGDGRDQGRTSIAQKQKNHKDGKHRPFDH